jgi:hypothetical protein
MKDSHLTLRLPAALARALARLAKHRGLPTSHVVREALVEYVAPAGDRMPPVANMTAGELARRWATLPRLSSDEADAYAADIAKARAALPRLKRPWA